MSFTQNKSVYLYIITFCLIILGCFLYFKISLDAYEERENIVLKFSSMRKIKNIYQMEDNLDNIRFNDIVVVVYDKNMLKVQDLKGEGVSEYNENMITNVQYARSGRLYLSKKNIVNLVEFRLKDKGLKYIKFYWTVSGSYFPITCKFEDNIIKECVEKDEIN